MVVSQRKAGAILSYVSLVVNAAASLVYVPILLSVLTTAEYGVYELIGSIIAYLSVMDMGLSTTLSRFYVKSKISESEEKTQNLLAMSAIVYGVLTLLAVVAGIIINTMIDPLFGGSFTPFEIELAHQMMLLVIINCAIVLPGNWFLALINANERFVFARTVSIVKYLLQVLVVILVLNWEAGALAVLTVQVVMSAIAIVAYIVYCKCKLNVRAKLKRWDWALARSLFAFSFFILLNMVFDQLFWKTGQVVLGIVVNASAVAVYGIACKIITSAYMQVSTGVAGVFLPKVTAIAARTEDMSEINDAFIRIGHIQGILVWGVCAAFAVLGQEFVYLWAGSEFGDAYGATLILMLALSISLMQNMGVIVLQAKNKMGFRSVAYVVMGLLSVVLAFPAAKHYGVLGCAAVTAILDFIGTVLVMNIYYRKVIGIDIVGFFKSVLPLLIPASIAAIGTMLFQLLILPGYSWVHFLIACVVFVALYCFVLQKAFFSDYERSLLSSVKKKIFR